MLFYRFFFCRLVIGLFIFSFISHAQEMTHIMLMSPSATIKSIKSGRWADASIWDKGRVPKSSDNVLISQGHKVDLGSAAQAGTLSIKGELEISRTNSSSITVSKNILVLGGGELDMGSPEGSIPSGVTSTIIFKHSFNEGSSYTGDHGFFENDYGLWVGNQGKWSAMGAKLKRTWAKLSEEASPGATSVTINAELSDWKVGDEILVTNTEIPLNYYLRESDQRWLNSSGVDRNETRKIKNVSIQNGKTAISFDLPLEHKHACADGLCGEVANLSRNIKISTEFTDKDAGSVAQKDRKFAHTMFTHGSSGTVRYVEFKHMGNYGTKGRYPIHLHLSGESSRGMIVRGNSCHYTGLRCVNLHATHGVIIEDNISYEASSTPFFTETSDTGYASDNVFVHNLGTGTRPKTFDDRSNSAVFGDYHRYANFWPGNKTVHEAYLGNVSAGTLRSTKDGAGFHFPEGGNSPISKGNIPFTFVSNEAHGSTANGIHAWSNSVPSREIVATKLWNNGKTGLNIGAYGNRLKVYNITSVGNAYSQIEVKSVDSFVQDGLLKGVPGAAGSPTLDGIKINAYVMPQGFSSPAIYNRLSFEDLPDHGIRSANTKTECSGHNFEEFMSGNEDLRFYPVFPEACSANYVYSMRNSFKNVGLAFNLGQQSNPNSFWKVFKNTVDGEAVPDAFYFLKEAQTPSSRGSLTSGMLKAHGGGTIDEASHSYRVPYDQVQSERSLKYTGFRGIDKVETITPEVPSGASENQMEAIYSQFFEDIETVGLKEGRDIFRQTWKRDDFSAEPPKISMKIQKQGDFVKARIESSIASGAITRVEVKVDWKTVATIPSPGAVEEVEFSLSSLDELGLKLERHYIYAVAYSGQLYGSIAQPATIEEQGVSEEQAMTSIAKDYHFRAFSEVAEVFNGEDFGEPLTLKAVSFSPKQYTDWKGDYYFKVLTRYDGNERPAGATIHGKIYINNALDREFSQGVGGSGYTTFKFPQDSAQKDAIYKIVIESIDYPGIYVSSPKSYEWVMPIGQ